MDLTANDAPRLYRDGSGDGIGAWRQQIGRGQEGQRVGAIARRKRLAVKAIERCWERPRLPGLTIVPRLSPQVEVASCHSSLHPR